MAETKCPKCQKKIEYVNFSACYREWGKAHGTAEFDGCENIEETESNEYETDEYEYFCPLEECRSPLEWDDLENLEAISRGDELPNPEQEGYEYYTGEKTKEIKTTEATTDEGIVIESEGKNDIFVFKCPDCKEEIITEKIKRTEFLDPESKDIFADATCICGKELTQENSKIINY